MDNFENVHIANLLDYDTVRKNIVHLKYGCQHAESSEFISALHTGK